MNDQETFAFAGLWDSSRTVAGEMIRSVTHYTAGQFAAGRDSQYQGAHAPPKEDREAWLSGTHEEAWNTLKSYPDGHMVAWPVSSRVNSPKNDEAILIQPISQSC